MTYLDFHLIFNLPLLVLLLWFARKRMTPVHWKWFGVVALIVMAFTFPWDNYAVKQGIWGFGEDRVLFRVDALPIEEILFFLIEALAVCLVTIHFLPSGEEAS